MKSILDKFYNLYLERLNSNSHNDRFKVKHTINFIIISYILSTLFAISYLNDLSNNLWYYNLFLSPIILLSLPILYLTKSIRISVHFGIASGFLLISIYMANTQGILSPGLHWPYLLPLLAALVLTIYDALAWLFINILFYLFLFFNNQHNYFDFNTSLISQDPYYILASTIGIMVFTTFISSIFVYNSKELLKDTEQKKLDYESLIQIIAHDIANPITIIESTVTLKKRKNEDDKDLDRILRSTATLKEIVSKVRDLRILDSGKKTIKVISCEINDAISHIQFIFQEMLKQKEITLTVFLEKENGEIIKNPASIPIRVMADPVTFRNQVLSNLISNAIKFSNQKSEIIITIKQIKDKDRTQIIISDEGIGIPPSIRQKIYSINKETNRVGTQGEKGTGFGMILVKNFVEKYNGTIHLESRTKEEGYIKTGTIVSITLNNGDKVFS